MCTSSPLSAPCRVEELRSAVRSLTDVARVLKHRRAQGGAIELDSVEVKVQMSEDKDATKIENLIPKQVYTCTCMYMHVHDDAKFLTKK